SPKPVKPSTLFLPLLTPHLITAMFCPGNTRAPAHYPRFLISGKRVPPQLIYSPPITTTLTLNIGAIYSFAKAIHSLFQNIDSIAPSLQKHFSPTGITIFEDSHLTTEIRRIIQTISPFLKHTTLFAKP